MSITRIILLEVLRKMPKKSRPLGITIIALLVGLISILQIFGAGLGIIGAGFIALFFSGILGLITAVVTVLLLIVGIIGFRVAQGLWGLKPWAWNWSVVWTILVLILNIVGGSIWSALLGLIVLIYLFTVRGHF